MDASKCSVFDIIRNLLHENYIKYKMLKEDKDKLHYVLIKYLISFMYNQILHC